MKKPASTASCQITGSNVRLASVSELFAQLVPVTEADMPFQYEKKAGCMLSSSVNGGHCHDVDEPPHR